MARDKPTNIKQFNLIRAQIKQSPVTSWTTASPFLSLPRNGSGAHPVGTSRFPPLRLRGRSVKLTAHLQVKNALHYPHTDVLNTCNPVTI
jgi:hypothetical protein